MGEDYDEFQQFNAPKDTESEAKSASTNGSSVPDVAARGFFAPEYEATPEIGIEKEPARGRKIAGSIISLIGGGFAMGIYAIALFIGLILGLVFLLSDALAFIILITTLGVGVVGAILTFIGGIMGLSSQTRRGDKLAVLGSILYLTVSIISYLLYPSYATLNQPIFSNTIYITFFCSLLSIIGAIILWTAYRTSYYLD